MHVSAPERPWKGVFRVDTMNDPRGTDPHRTARIIITIILFGSTFGFFVIVNYWIATQKPILMIPATALTLALILYTVYAFSKDGR